jgi:integrase
MSIPANLGAAAPPDSGAHTTQEATQAPPATPAALVATSDATALAAAAADRAARNVVIADYQERLDPDTLRRQRADLALFAQYLAAANIVMSTDIERVATSLWGDSAAWAPISWGLVAGFVRWQLQEGYAIGSINVRLATVKRYCQLAMAAGALAPDAYQLIKTVRGYSGRQARAINRQRGSTRISTKKAEAIVLAPAQVQTLKQQPATPQGRRDALIVCLLLDHGLRVGELAALQVDAIDLEQGMLTFYREKVDKTQRHALSADALAAARAYLELDRPQGTLLQGSRKDSSLHGTMSDRAIRERVRLFGSAIGIPNLSPHDLRHTWATRAARAKTDPFALRDAGGWSSLDMPNRYVESSTIANQNVRLDE